MPTLHASLARGYSQNIVFGGIDYEAQINALLEHSNGKIASFGDGSRLSGLLNEQISSIAPSAHISTIDNKSVDLKGKKKLHMIIYLLFQKKKEKFQKLNM